MSKRKLRADRIEVIKNQRQELDDRIKELLKEERIAEKKKRDRRISRRGGLLESISPDIIPLTDEQFDDFLRTVLSSDFARRTLDGYTVQTDEVILPAVDESTPEVEEVREVAAF